MASSPSPQPTINALPPERCPLTQSIIIGLGDILAQGIIDGSLFAKSYSSSNQAIGSSFIAAFAVEINFSRSISVMSLIIITYRRLLHHQIHYTLATLHRPLTFQSRR